jgi:hypothetical protein
MQDEWLGASETRRLVEAGVGRWNATLTIAKRAHAGLIRTKAERFIAGTKAFENVELPKIFWWAEGHQALTQVWETGDFETNNPDRFSRERWQAFGVQFFRADVEKLPLLATPMRDADSGIDSGKSKGGRPEEYDWDVMLGEVLRIADADGIPDKQSELVEMLLAWFQHHYKKEPSESNVKQRISDLYRHLRDAKTMKDRNPPT